MNDPNFAQFLQMLLQANPQIGMNQGNMNPGMYNNINPQQIQNFLNSMGIYGANPFNFINIFNPQPQRPQYIPTSNNNSQNYINVIFIQRNNKAKITIQTTWNESVASLVNKYITKSLDYKINMYILNGHKLDERLKVGEAGIINNCNIDVVELDELEGA